VTRRDRGIVLVAVLLAVTVMSVMVVAVSALVRSGISSQRVETKILATRYALLSGLEGAEALILSTPPEDRVFLDATAETIDVGNGVQLNVSIRDAAGLADINRSDLALIEALLAENLNPAAAEDIAGRIASLREQAAAGKDQGTGTTAADGPVQKVSNGPKAPVVFQAIEQLLAMTEPEAAQPLAAYLTVYNPTGLLNPLAAPEEVLAAVPGMTGADLRLIKGVRKSRAWEADMGFKSLLERLKPFLAVAPPSIFVIEVEVQDGQGLIRQSNVGAMIQLNVDGPQPFRTLWISEL
jgi:general secretion pathway protein K